MTRVGPRRCVVCGTASGRIESNHLAARANDRALVLPWCAACHAEFTDWQWQLGILRRESIAARGRHSESERFWALCEGFAVLALMASPEEQERWWVAFARAAGTFEKIRDEQSGRDDAWGPKPAMARPARGRLPTRRSHGDPQAVLAAVVQAGDTWLAADPSWSKVRQVLTLIAAGSEHLPSEWQPVVEQLENTLRNIGSANGPRDLESDREQRGATLDAIRSLFVRSPSGLTATLRHRGPPT